MYFISTKEKDAYVLFSFSQIYGDEAVLFY